MNCRITRRALETIATTAQQSHDGLETGGVLLGLEESGDILITSAGTPGPKAHRGADAFHRDLDHAAQLAATAWQTDHSQWIGEWHTHPSGYLVPSTVDLRSYMRHVSDTELHLDRFIAIIVGLTGGRGVAAQTWIVTRTRVLPTALMVQDANRE